MKILDQDRIDAYRRQQATLPFNERELPFTDADVIRCGGTEFSDSDEENEGTQEGMEQMEKLSDGEDEIPNGLNTSLEA